MLLLCPYCNKVDHLSNWVLSTSNVLQITIISAAYNTHYFCPKCQKPSIAKTLPRIQHH